MEKTLRNIIKEILEQQLPLQQVTQQPGIEQQKQSVEDLTNVQKTIETLGKKADTKEKEYRQTLNVKRDVDPVRNELLKKAARMEDLENKKNAENLKKAKEVVDKSLGDLEKMQLNTNQKQTDQATQTQLPSTPTEPAAP